MLDETGFTRSKRRFCSACRLYGNGGDSTFSLLPFSLDAPLPFSCHHLRTAIVLFTYSLSAFAEATPLLLISCYQTTPCAVLYLDAALDAAGRHLR